MIFLKGLCVAIVFWSVAIWIFYRLIYFNNIACFFGFHKLNHKKSPVNSLVKCSRKNCLLYAIKINGPNGLKVKYKAGNEKNYITQYTP